MKKLLLAAVLAVIAFAAAPTAVSAQNITCATRPITDDSNACANTAFVNDFISNPSSPIFNTPHTWTATQTFSVVNPSMATCPLSSFYSPFADPGSKGAVCVTSTRTTGGLGFTDAALVVNTEITGYAGAAGGIIGGTLNKSGISTLDSFGVLGIIANDSATTFPVGAAV